jgi:hypothetical protein
MDIHDAGCGKGDRTIFHKVLLLFLRNKMFVKSKWALRVLFQNCEIDDVIVQISD